jgi:hypothetical protein
VKADNIARSRGRRRHLRRRLGDLQRAGLRRRDTRMRAAVAGRAA